MSFNSTRGFSERTPPTYGMHEGLMDARNTAARATNLTSAALMVRSPGTE